MIINIDKTSAKFSYVSKRKVEFLKILLACETYCLNMLTSENFPSKSDAFFPQISFLSVILDFFCVAKWQKFA